MIKLYETYHAGGISKIMAKNPAGHWVTLYTAPKLEIINSSRVFSPNLTVKMTIHDTDSKWSMKSCFWDHLDFQLLGNWLKIFIFTKFFATRLTVLFGAPNKKWCYTVHRNLLLQYLYFLWLHALLLVGYILINILIGIIIELCY